MIIKNCLFCNEEFKIYKQKHKFCSQPCYWNFLKGKSSCVKGKHWKLSNDYIPWNKGYSSKIKTFCIKCHKEFFVWPSIIKRKGGKYCSNKCSFSSKIGKKLSEIVKMNMSKGMKGRIPWNKGKKGIQIAWNKGLKTGISPCVGQKRPTITGKNNCAWKGEKVGYLGLHAWVKRNLGQPNQCEHCGKIINNTKSIHWANKSGLYLRNLSDWLRLCCSCHKKYDIKRKFLKEQSLNINS